MRSKPSSPKVIPRAAKGSESGTHTLTSTQPQHMRNREDRDWDRAFTARRESVRTGGSHRFLILRSRCLGGVCHSRIGDRHRQAETRPTVHAPAGSRADRCSPKSTAILAATALDVRGTPFRHETRLHPLKEGIHRPHMGSIPHTRRLSVPTASPVIHHCGERRLRSSRFPHEIAMVKPLH